MTTFRRMSQPIELVTVWIFSVLMSSVICDSHISHYEPHEVDVHHNSLLPIQPELVRTFEHCHKHSPTFDLCIRNAFNELRVYFKTGKFIFNLEFIWERARWDLFLWDILIHKRTDKPTIWPVSCPPCSYVIFLSRFNNLKCSKSKIFSIESPWYAPFGNVRYKKLWIWTTFSSLKFKFFANKTPISVPNYSKVMNLNTKNGNRKHF